MSKSGESILTGTINTCLSHNSSHYLQTTTEVVSHSHIFFLSTLENDVSFSNTHLVKISLKDLLNLTDEKQVRLTLNSQDHSIPRSDAGFILHIQDTDLTPLMSTALGKLRFSMVIIEVSFKSNLYQSLMETPLACTDLVHPSGLLFWKCNDQFYIYDDMNFLTKDFSLSKCDVEGFQLVTPFPDELIALLSLPLVDITGYLPRFNGKPIQSSKLEDLFENMLGSQTKIIGDIEICNFINELTNLPSCMIESYMIHIRKIINDFQTNLMIGKYNINKIFSEKINMKKNSDTNFLNIKHLDQEMIQLTDVLKSLVLDLNTFANFVHNKLLNLQPIKNLKSFSERRIFVDQTPEIDKETVLHVKSKTSEKLNKMEIAEFMEFFENDENDCNFLVMNYTQNFVNGSSISTYHSRKCIPRTYEYFLKSSTYDLLDMIEFMIRIHNTSTFFDSLTGVELLEAALLNRYNSINSPVSQLNCEPIRPVQEDCIGSMLLPIPTKQTLLFGTDTMKLTFLDDPINHFNIGDGSRCIFYRLIMTNLLKEFSEFWDTRKPQDSIELEHIAVTILCSSLIKICGNRIKTTQENFDDENAIRIRDLLTFIMSYVFSGTDNRLSFIGQCIQPGRPQIPDQISDPIAYTVLIAILDGVRKGYGEIAFDHVVHQTKWLLIQEFIDTLFVVLVTKRSSKKNPLNTNATKLKSIPDIPTMIKVSRDHVSKEELLITCSECGETHNLYNKIPQFSRNSIKNAKRTLRTKIRSEELQHKKEILITELGESEGAIAASEKLTRKAVKDIETPSDWTTKLSTYKIPILCIKCVSDKNDQPINDSSGFRHRTKFYPGKWYDKDNLSQLLNPNFIKILDPKKLFITQFHKHISIHKNVLQRLLERIDWTEDDLLEAMGGALKSLNSNSEFNFKTAELAGIRAGDKSSKSRRNPPSELRDQIALLEWWKNS